MKKLLLLIISFLLTNCYSAFCSDIQTNLNGFSLLQFKGVPSKYFGPPAKQIELESSIAEMYIVDEKSYMVFEYSKSNPNFIYSLQITGNTSEMIPFKGKLSLGDMSGKVIDILGKPSTISELDDPKVKVYKYDNSNYSIEIDESDKVYSIKLSFPKELVSKVDNDQEHWNEFKKIILAKDVESILLAFRPDGEILINDKALIIDKKIDEFVKNPDPEFLAALIGNDVSVFNEIQSNEVEVNIRIMEKVGVGMVYKFPSNSKLKEIVFCPYNGKYKIFEISFNGKG